MALKFHVNFYYFRLQAMAHTWYVVVIHLPKKFKVYYPEYVFRMKMYPQ